MATALHPLADDPELLDLEAAEARAREIERAVFRSVFAPRVRKNLLEWAEESRWLSPEANALAAEAGGPVRYSADATPYHREIMLALSDPRTKKVVAMLPSQDGKTELLNNFIGHKIDLDPGPMLVLQPTKEMGEAWSKDRLAPMIRDSPALRGKVREARSRDSENTITHKKFPGGHLTIVGSNSAAGLASRPIRDVLVDEVDRCAPGAGKEGDPISLAFRRATTFRRGKKLLISSPTIKGASRIKKEYDLGTQEELHLPCPHCGEYQFIEWGGVDAKHGLKWEPGKPETVHYVCRANGCRIEEHEKAGMIARYRFEAQNPSAGPRVRSFWKNALSSNLIAWRDLVEEWLGAQGKPLELQTFINTVMCELFDPVEGEEVSAEGLFKRLGQGYPADPTRIPNGVAVLTRSVDAQGDRLETTVWGWGEGEEAWLLDFQLLEGDPAMPGVWKLLDAERRKAYTTEAGTVLRPVVTFVDSGNGNHTKAVYAYTRARHAQGVYSIKGSNLEGAPLLAKPTRNNESKAILHMVGSYSGKMMLMHRLTKVTTPGPRYIHLPADLDSEQVAQFTRERLISRPAAKGGKRKLVWSQFGANEQIDLYVYALAALQKLGLKVRLALGHIAARNQAKAEGRAIEAPETSDAPDLAGGEPESSDVPEVPDIEEPATPARGSQRRKSPRRGSWMDGIR